MQNIERSVQRGERGVAVATFVRDLSASVLVVGSAFLSGGSSLAVLGGGSLLRGTANYQDTGNIGSAALEATGTLVVGAIPIGAAAAVEQSAAQTVVRLGEAVNASGTAGQQAFVVVAGSVMDAHFEGCKALAEGQTTEQALRAASLRLGVDVITGGLGARLDRRAFPVAARLVTDTLSSEMGDMFMDDMTRQASTGSPTGSTTATGAASRLPEPSAPICDANATLITGECGPQAWVHQLVLQIQ
jgi:hypothetical protein